jgi:osmotically-inducible protein OsmY
MFIRTTLAAVVAGMAVLTMPGCAARGQGAVDSHVNGAGTTPSVKARLMKDERVAGMSISVETLNGAVMLSGFAKNQLERDAAENIARRSTA